MFPEKDSVKMILLWTTLIVLQQVYAQISFMTIERGKPATLQCFVQKGFARRQLKWYKQSAGDTLKIITSIRPHVNLTFGPGFPPSRFQLTDNSDVISLTIFETTHEDEGMYHCALMDWMDAIWSTTYLSIKGSTEGISNNVTVHGPTVSSAVHEGNSATLECSVLSTSRNKSCPAQYSFYWFRAAEDKSIPNALYVSGEKHNECDSQSCVYHFSKNISYHDMGTYYCAVAACGEILLGNGIRLEATHGFGGSLWSKVSSFWIFLPSAAIALGSAVIYLLILKTNNSALFCAGGKQRNQRSLKNQRDKDMCCYSAALFTVIKADKGDVLDANAAERRRIFTAVKAFGLN